jgi:hypothetical protein
MKQTTSTPVFEAAELMPFNLGNAIKCGLRRYKRNDGPIEELEKMAWYVRREQHLRRSVNSPIIGEKSKARIVELCHALAEKETAEIRTAIHYIGRAATQAKARDALAMAAGAIEREIAIQKAKIESS